jgi:hypothetical protein
VSGPLGDWVRTGGRAALAVLERKVMSVRWLAVSLGVEQPTQNWSGQGESDCLIKTKHCDGRRRC